MRPLMCDSPPDVQTDSNEIVVGQNAWNAACAYARSTAGQSSTALLCFS